MNKIFCAQNIKQSAKYKTVVWASRMTIHNNSTRTMVVTSSSCYVHLVDSEGVYHQTILDASRGVVSKGSFIINDTLRFDLKDGITIQGLYVDFDVLSIVPDASTLGDVTDFVVSATYYDGNFSSTSYSLTSNNNGLQPNKHTTDEFYYTGGPMPISEVRVASHLEVDFSWSN